MADPHPVVSYSKRAQFDDVADAANAALCPYSVMVYATAQDPGMVHVAYRRPWRPDGSAASKAALKTVEALLDGIAREQDGRAAGALRLMTSHP